MGQQKKKKNSFWKIDITYRDAKNTTKPKC